MAGGKKEAEKLVVLKNVFSRGVVLPSQGEWHKNRRKAILAKHPEIKALFGNEPKTFFWICVVFFVLTYVSIIARVLPWWAFLILSYTLGAWLSFDASMLGHEAVHELVFKAKYANKLAAIFAFLPSFLGSFAIFWATEHIWHHGVVVDKCMRYGSQSNSMIKKVIFVGIFALGTNVILGISSLFMGCQMIFVFIRRLIKGDGEWLPIKTRLPGFDRFPTSINGWLLLNLLAAVCYTSYLYYNWGFSPILFQILSCSFANGLHPLGMRQVQEHYYVVKDQPTTSVYAGIVNTLTFNVGYHVEHHDFSAIPHQRLPRVRELAPEFYDNLFAYSSYTEIFIKFFTTKGMTLHDIFHDNPLYIAAQAA